MSNFIIPISSLPSIQSIAQPKVAGQNPVQGLPFADILQNAIGDMAAAGQKSEQSTYNLAVGGSDDLHSGVIDGLKYRTAINYASNLASSAVRAYNELMRMQI